MDKNELIDVLAEWCNSEELSFGESGRLGDVIDKALEGHVIVPVEPTDEMVDAAIKGVPMQNIQTIVVIVRRVYKAMINANKE